MVAWHFDTEPAKVIDLEVRAELYKIDDELRRLRALGPSDAIDRHQVPGVIEALERHKARLEGMLS